jgi:molecular chaperone DnaK (HSP70)
MAVTKKQGKNGRIIYFGVDLGSDSLKISYVVYDQDSNEDKIFPLYFQDGRDSVPGYGFYDEHIDEWYFGADMFTGKLGKFDTIVEIKKQLRLVDEETAEGAKPYNSSHEFRKYGEDIQRSVRREYKPTFSARRDTPQTVVEKFFTYVYKERLLPRAKMIYEEQGVPFDGKCNCVFTYPAGVTDRYKKEYRRIAEKAGFVVVRMVPEASMAGLYAFRYFPNLNGHSALIVDVGETRYTASRVVFNSGIEVKKELPVAEMGGLDYDMVLGDYVKQQAGMSEELSSLRKFFFNQELKHAKELVLANRRGVAVAYVGEATAEIYITREKFKEVTLSVREKIAKRIVEDVKASGEKTIILTGGCMDSYGIREGIRTLLKENNLDSVQIISSQEKAHKGRFLVSLGAALLACGKYKTQLIAPLSYGVLVKHNGRFVFSPILKAGKLLPAVETKGYTTQSSTSSYNIRIYSSSCMDEDFLSGKVAMLPDSHPSVKKMAGGSLKFPYEIPAGYPLKVEISVDQDGVGRVRAYACKQGTSTIIAEFTSAEFEMEN